MVFECMVDVLSNEVFAAEFGIFNLAEERVINFLVEFITA